MGVIRGYWALCNGPSDDNLNVEALRTGDGGDESNTCSMTRAACLITPIHKLHAHHLTLPVLGQVMPLVTYRRRHGLGVTLH